MPPEGYLVLTALDGAEALGIVSSMRVDVVLLDVRMPRLDGLTFARRLRERGNTTPIILTAAAPTFQQNLPEIGAVGFLPKPFELQALLDLVAAACLRSEGVPAEATDVP